MTSLAPLLSYVCVWPTIASVYGCFAMIASRGSTPGAVFAVADSWRTTNVYVVGLRELASSQVACALVHALAATKTNFAVHAPLGPSMWIDVVGLRLPERREQLAQERVVVHGDAVGVARAAVGRRGAGALVVAHRGETRS